MIKIGKYTFGLAPVSMVVLFIVLSVIAVLSAYIQAHPEWPMPLSSIIVINETIALLVTLMYGILLHLSISLIAWLRKRKR